MFEKKWSWTVGKESIEGHFRYMNIFLKGNIFERKISNRECENSLHYDNTMSTDHRRGHPFVTVLCEEQKEPGKGIRAEDFVRHFVVADESGNIMIVDTEWLVRNCKFANGGAVMDNYMILTNYTITVDGVVRRKPYAQVHLAYKPEFLKYKFREGNGICRLNQYCY